MDKKIESIYQTIADEIVNSIPQEWETAWIEAEIEDDYAGIDGYFTNKNQTDAFECSDVIFDAFEEMRIYFSNINKERYNMAIFKLDSNGKFEIDFKWVEDE